MKSISQIKKEILIKGFSKIGRQANVENLRKQFEVIAEWEEDGLYGRVIGYKLYRKEK